MQPNKLTNGFCISSLHFSYSMADSVANKSVREMFACVRIIVYTVKPLNNGIARI